MPRFKRYIGIDYSGAETPDSSLKGLRVAVATPDSKPVLIGPPPGPKKYWTRKSLALWLAEILAEPIPAIVGIDHAFSFPVKYFRRHKLSGDWTAFLEDFRRHWPTDDFLYVDFIRDGSDGNGRARTGATTWRRLTERLTRAKSVFHFDVPGSVAKSTHAGLPWLLYLRQTLPDQLHFWPFDGWEPPLGKSVLAEAYPSLWNKTWRPADRTPDEHDAWVIAEWLRTCDAQGGLAAAFHPALTDEDRGLAETEGWIIGALAGFQTERQ